MNHFILEKLKRYEQAKNSSEGTSLCLTLPDIVLKKKITPGEKDLSA